MNVLAGPRAVDCTRRARIASFSPTTRRKWVRFLVRRFVRSRESLRSFASLADSAEHFASAFGEYFFAGQRAVLLALQSCGPNARFLSIGADMFEFCQLCGLLRSDSQVFQTALATLQKRSPRGELDMMLYSKFVRERLFYFVAKIRNAKV